MRILQQFQLLLIEVLLITYLPMLILMEVLMSMPEFGLTGIKMVILLIQEKNIIWEVQTV